MAAQTKRRAVTLKRRMEIIDEVEKAEKTKTMIARKFRISLSTLTTIMKNKEKYRAHFNSGLFLPEQQKRFRLPQHQDVDKHLLDWFHCTRSLDIPMNGLVLKAKADELAKSFGIKDWRCNDGWLSRWKRRHGIFFRPCTFAPSTQLDGQPNGVSHGEENGADGVGPSSDDSGSLDGEALEHWVEDVLRPALVQYEPKDVFSLDETALFWRLLPEQTYTFCTDRCQRGERSSDRMTVMVCCNRDGSEKLPLLTVGKFQDPRCFSGIQRLPVEYTANPRSWMTADIFTEWLQSFDRIMEGQNRKVLLFLDKISVHEVPLLKATEILFLPSKTNADYHPCKAGVVQSLKAHYRAMQAFRFLAHVEVGGTVDNYQFSLLDAVCLLKQAWHRVTPSSIRNSFHRAGFETTNKNSHGGHANRTTPRALLDCEEGTTIDLLESRMLEEWNVPACDYFSVDDDVATCERLVSASHASGPGSTMPNAVSTSGSREAYTSSLEEVYSSLLDSEEADEAYSNGHVNCQQQSEQVSSKTVLDCVQKINTYCLQKDCSDEIMTSLSAFVQALHKHLAGSRRLTKMEPPFGEEGLCENQTERGGGREDQEEEKRFGRDTDCEFKAVKQEVVLDELGQTAGIKIECVYDA